MSEKFATDINVGDTIYRRAAIDAVNIAYTITEVVNNRPVNDYERELYFRIQGELSKLPPAQPQRKTGKWVELSHGILFHVYKCDQCGNTIDMNGVNAGRGDANYCPSCGVRMAGEKR